MEPLKRPTSDHRFIITLGLHGSASTWAYNVAREAMITAFGRENVVAFYMDAIGQLFEQRDAPGRRVVCKTHGVPELPILLHLAGATVLLTIRDPRDAVLSLMERFDEPMDRCVAGIARDCQYALAVSAFGCGVLRYEDRFFDRPGAVGEVARHIGAAIPQAEAERICAAYSTESVRAFGRGLDSLPAERVSEAPKTRLDLVTQIHERHIGDARVGKWRERLDPAQQEALTKLFAPFLKAFRYE